MGKTAEELDCLQSALVAGQQYGFKAALDVCSTVKDAATTICNALGHEPNVHPAPTAANPEPASPPADAAFPRQAGGETFAPLLAYAHQHLSRNERRIVDLVCEGGGSMAIADLAIDEVIDWQEPWKDAWDSARKRLNIKLKKAGLPWKLSRKHSRAMLNRQPPTARRSGRK
jgi:hypothetical protein